MAAAARGKGRIPEGSREVGREERERRRRKPPSPSPPSRPRPGAHGASHVRVEDEERRSPSGGAGAEVLAAGEGLLYFGRPTRRLQQDRLT